VWRLRRSECYLARSCGRVGCLVIVYSHWARYVVPNDASKLTPKENKNRAARQATMMRSRENYSENQHYIQGFSARSAKVEQAADNQHLAL
jgi:hypothetical protein